MTPVTAAQLCEYFHYAKHVSPEAPCQQSPEAFEQALESVSLIPILYVLAFNAAATGGDKALIATLWASGFHMGREFESRRQELDELAKLERSAA